MWASDSRKENSLAFFGQRRKHQQENFVSACQNAEQMLQQKSKQFIQHWQSRTEEKKLS